MNNAIFISSVCLLLYMLVIIRNFRFISHIYDIGVLSLPKKAKLLLKKKEKLKQEEKVEMKPISKHNNKTNNNNNGLPMKIHRPRFAIGGLDQDLSEWSGGGKEALSKKQVKRMAENEKEFKEFDPNMRLRKGGKPGKSSFKSKARFKRRK